VGNGQGWQVDRPGLGGGKSHSPHIQGGHGDTAKGGEKAKGGAQKEGTVGGPGQGVECGPEN